MMTPVSASPMPPRRRRPGPSPVRTRLLLKALLAVAALTTLTFLLPPAHAQGPPPGSQTQPQSPDQTDTGGPSTDNGPIVIPKKKEPADEPPPPAPAEPKVRNPNNETYSLRVDVPIVNLDVSVILDKNHQFVRGLKPANFLILEDGVEQKVDTVRITQTPITAVMLLEFAANSYYLINDMRNASVSFFRSLQPNDYVAVMTYDLNTHILSDFTNDKSIIAQSLQLAHDPYVLRNRYVRRPL